MDDAAVLDTETFKQYEEIVAWCKVAGMSVPEALDRKELLLTPRRHHNITVKALEDMYRRLDRQSPNRIMAHAYGRADGTPAEMFEAMKIWFEAVIRNQSNGTISDI